MSPFGMLVTAYGIVIGVLFAYNCALARHARKMKSELTERQNAAK